MVTAAITTGDGDTRVTLAGELDVSTAPTLRAVLVEATDPRPDRVVIDLSDVTYLDSTGLGVLVGAHRRAVAYGGALAFICPAGRVRHLFELTGMSGVFTLYESAPADRWADAPFRGMR